MVPEKDTTTTTQTASADSAQEKAKISKLPRRRNDSRRQVGAKERFRAGARSDGKSCTLRN